jgi:hypothetical protein
LKQKINERVTEIFDRQKLKDIQMQEEFEIEVMNEEVRRKEDS